MAGFLEFSRTFLPLPPTFPKLKRLWKASAGPQICRHASPSKSTVFAFVLNILKLTCLLPKIFKLSYFCFYFWVGLHVTLAGLCLVYSQRWLWISGPLCPPHLPGHEITGVYCQAQFIWNHDLMPARHVLYKICYIPNCGFCLIEIVSCSLSWSWTSCIA